MHVGGGGFPSKGLSTRATYHTVPAQVSGEVIQSEYFVGLPRELVACAVDPLRENLHP